MLHSIQKPSLKKKKKKRKRKKRRDPCESMNHHLKETMFMCNLSLLQRKKTAYLYLAKLMNVYMAHRVMRSLDYFLQTIILRISKTMFSHQILCK